MELECWVEDLSPAQLAAYERVANEHNAIKNALKSALSANDGKELFNGQVFQAYSFKGKVLQELKEATVPKKSPKAEAPATTANEKSFTRSGRKRAPNFVYLESSDEEEDDVPLAKRIAAAGAKNNKLADSASTTPGKAGKKGAAAVAAANENKGAVAATTPKSGKAAKEAKTKSVKTENVSTPPPNFRPSEDSAVGGLIIGSDKDGKTVKEKNEVKLQGKTFPSLVVLAKPWLKVKDMSATRNKLDSKVKLVLMLTPNKFTEWLIQEGLLKAEQKCANHKNNDLKLGKLRSHNNLCVCVLLNERCVLE